MMKIRIPLDVSFVDPSAGDTLAEVMVQELRAATRVVAALAAVSPEGLTRTGLHGLLSRNIDARSIDAAIATLMSLGRVRCSTPDTVRGRSPSIYTLVEPWCPPRRILPDGGDAGDDEGAEAS